MTWKIPKRNRWEDMTPEQQKEWERYRSMHFFVFDMAIRNTRLDVRVRSRVDPHVVVIDRKKQKLSQRIIEKWSRLEQFTMETLRIVRCPTCQTGPLKTCSLHW